MNCGPREVKGSLKFVCYNYYLNNNNRETIIWNVSGNILKSNTNKVMGLIFFLLKWIITQQGGSILA